MENSQIKNFNAKSRGERVAFSEKLVQFADRDADGAGVVVLETYAIVVFFGKQYQIREAAAITLEKAKSIGRFVTVFETVKKMEREN